MKFRKTLQVGALVLGSTFVASGCQTLGESSAYNECLVAALVGGIVGGIAAEGVEGAVVGAIVAGAGCAIYQYMTEEQVVEMDEKTVGFLSSTSEPGASATFEIQGGSFVINTLQDVDFNELVGEELLAEAEVDVSTCRAYTQEVTTEQSFSLGGVKCLNAEGDYVQVKSDPIELAEVDVEDEEDEEDEEAETSVG